jgi:hypothetical protein
VSGERAYPLPCPADDPRFTRGLAFDVAQVLEKYGYPKVADVVDFRHLQEALFDFIYEPSPDAADCPSGDRRG